jgi:uncharacterized protein (TIGR02147 family)
MPDVFRYTDYRKYLADYYAERKQQNPHFSYKTFSNIMGFPNKGFLHNIISGAKNMSKSTAAKISEALKLCAKEAEYFEDLVFFCQAQTYNEKKLFYDRLKTIKSNRAGAAHIRETRKDQYEFYSNWYISVIRSVIDMHAFKDDYQWLANNVYPPIKAAQARKAVELMAKLGMIRKRRNGTWKAVDKTITAGKDILQLGLQNFQLQTTELAAQAQRKLPKDKRNISGLTLGISRKTYDWICCEIAQLQERIMAVAEQDKHADNVYQLNFHFFPVSNIKGAATPRRKTKGL